MALDIPPPIPYPGMGTPVTGGGSDTVKVGGQKVTTKSTSGYVPDGSKATQHHKAPVNVHGMHFAPMSAAVGGADLGTAIADDAKTRVGAPYKTGGKGQLFTVKGSKATGDEVRVPAYDCSGFTEALLKKAGCGVKGRWIPHSAEGQMRLGKPVKQKDLQPGDLVFFKDKAGKIKHVGVFAGWIKDKDGKPKLDCHGQPMMRIVHASDHKQKMKVTDEVNGYNEGTRYYAGARRVRPDDDVKAERPLVQAWYSVRKAETKLESTAKEIAKAEKELAANPPEDRKKALQDRIEALKKTLPDLEAQVQKAKEALHKLEGDPEY